MWVLMWSFKVALSEALIFASERRVTQLATQNSCLVMRYGAENKNHSIVLWVIFFFPISWVSCFTREHVSGGKLETTFVTRVNMAPQLLRSDALARNRLVRIKLPTM